MTLNIWTEATGYDLGLYEDQTDLNIELPVLPDDTIIYSLIAGVLPDGLHLIGNRLIGNVNIVTDDTVYKFCIRAKSDTDQSERTFFLTIQSRNPLYFMTESGRLQCGINKQLFAFDDTYVNFKINATSMIQTDIINFSIVSGSLPNGVSLSEDGTISGMIKKLSNQTNDNQFLESHFTIEITNGIHTTSRSFSFIVVGPYYLTADNTNMKLGTVVFSADNINIRPVQWKTPNYLGAFRYDNFLTVEFDTYNNSTVVYNIDNSQILPPGTTFSNALLSGYVPPQNSYNTPYNFEISASRSNSGTGKTITTTKLFSLDIIGNLDNVFEWITPSIIGNIIEGSAINFIIEATNSITNSIIVYEIINGSLPPGISMSSNGILSGVYISTSSTEHINSYTFTVRASNQYSGEFSASVVHYGVIEREFTITVSNSSVLYSNILVKPMLELDIRNKWDSFITSEHIFPLESLYRPYDKNYGVQSKLEMLIFPGIESTSIETFFNATKNNNSKKRFTFGKITSAVAIDQETLTELYEVVYIEMIDPMERNGKHLPLSMNIPKINTYYPSSVSLWRERLALEQNVDTGLELSTDISFIPLWMRSIQPIDRTIIGFILAVPLCYCKIGHAAKIIKNIELNNFDFTILDYTIDRYIVNDFINPQYVIFNN